MHSNLNHQSRPEIRITQTPVGFRSHPFLWLLLCFLTAIAVLPELRAQTNLPPATNIALPNRFLLVVDTSASMKRRAGDVLKIVDGIIASGASGQLRVGDTLGVWTFNEDVYSDLPLQTWAVNEREQIASRTDDFLKQQRYAKTSRFDKLLPNLRDVIRASDIITIFIISNGEGKMKGTAFDQEINDLYQQNLKETKSHRVPIVTVLQAKGGRLLRYTVNAFPWPVVIPEVPITIKSVPAPPPVQPAPAVVRQNTPSPVPPLIFEKPVPPLVVKTESAPPVTAQPAPPAIVSPTPVITPSPVPIPAPSIATVPPAEVAPSTQPPPPVMATPLPVRPPIFSNNVPMSRSPRPMIPAPKPAVKPFVPADPTPDNNPPAVAPAKPVVVVNHTNPVPAVQPSPIVAATNDATAPATNTLFHRALAFISPASAGHPKSLLIAGLTLVVIAIVLVILMVRRSRDASGPSLITRSLGNKKK